MSPRSWLLVPLAGLALASPAADYEPIPKGWNIRIDAPGVLGVGAKYCTEAGECHQVGEDVPGFAIGGQPVGAPQACQNSPKHPKCLELAMPVHVIAASRNGAIIVRIQGRNYATTEYDPVTIEWRGKMVPAFQVLPQAPRN